MAVVSLGGVAMVEEYESLENGRIHNPKCTSWRKATTSYSSEVLYPTESIEDIGFFVHEQLC